MRTVTLTMPGDPRGKGRPKATARSGHVRMYADSETVSAEHAWRWLFVHECPGFTPHSGPVAVTVSVGHPIPASWSGKRKARALIGEIRPGKPDLDNVVKCVVDALNHVAYDDDKRVAWIVAEKHYAESPQTVATIEFQDES